MEEDSKINMMNNVNDKKIKYLDVYSSYEKWKNFFFYEWETYKSKINNYKFYELQEWKKLEWKE